MGTPVIELKDVVRVYRLGDTELRALDGVNLTVSRWRISCHHGRFRDRVSPR